MITLGEIQEYVNDKIDENMILSNNTRIIDLGYDSLELLELIAYIEKSHSVEIKFSEISNRTIMQEFIELINNKIEKPNP
jgi:acyl carrier protein